MKAIEIISIPVTDQIRAKEFYLKLGFKVIVEAPFQGDQKWIQLGLPDGGVSITLVTWFDNMPAGCINGLVIKTDDLAKDKEELISKGLEVGEIDQTPWGQFMPVVDPDGNRISLHQGK
ncbi:MAG: glyoxalase superfamily protein [Candidatus Pedobacter colombiensis]|uniref:Glyoxalase superfamily protein n=1 Tax=Candidatus Pedobacter colombiensis TaxID=3121371 RepID=A0AAJ6B9Q9_9SPHI|nr:glyoxalase superfamily protein [Pedobacter sp.]WEK21736.1 MAG: glyoxalase superfamily protein [Pedobacter sp.]